MKDMTPTPWRIRKMHKDDPDSDFFVEADKTNLKAGYNIEIMGSEDGPNYTYGQKFADASAIVLAVNNTYGVGVNPEAVADMLHALKIALSHFDNNPGHHSALSVSQAETIRAAINKAKLTANA